MSSQHYNRSLHVIALLTAAATFPLIFMGGLVTSHGAGMSVPDWPNSYGYNMFLFPPRLWIGGIFYEHTPPLMGTLAGLLSIILILQAFAPARHRKVRTWIKILIPLTLLAAAARMFSSSAEKTQSVIGIAGVTLILAAAWFPRVAEERIWVRKLALAVLACVLFQGLLGGLRVVWVKLDLAVI